MSEDRGFIEETWGSIGEVYNQVAWGPNSPGAAETPDISGPVISIDLSGGADIGPPEMNDVQLQTLSDQVNHEADVAAYEAAGMDISGPEIGPSADIGMDFTPSDAGFAPPEDYAPQQADISAPDISGPDISADIGPSEGPDMG